MKTPWWEKARSFAVVAVAGALAFALRLAVAGFALWGVAAVCFGLAAVVGECRKPDPAPPPAPCMEAAYVVTSGNNPNGVSCGTGARMRITQITTGQLMRCECAEAPARR